MNDTPVRGCLVSLLVLAAIYFGISLLLRDSPPPSGPSCAEVAKRAMRQGATASDQRILDRCMQDMSDDRPRGRY